MELATSKRRPIRRTDAALTATRNGRSMIGLGARVLEPQEGQARQTGRNNGQSLPLGERPCQVAMELATSKRRPIRRTDAALTATRNGRSMIGLGARVLEPQE